MELAFDITKQQKQTETLTTIIHNESLVNTGLRYALAEQDPEKSIIIIMEYFGKALKGERIYIFEQIDNIYKNTYEWVAAGVEPQIENLQCVPQDVIEKWNEQFKKNELIIIQNLQTIKNTDPKLYAILEPQNIHSLIVAPLIHQNTIIGFLGIDNPPNTFITNSYNILTLLSQFVVSLIIHRNLVKQLEKISYYDQLTGAKNRHALELFIRDFDNTSNLGIFYADIMGLKKINDTHGHEQGDELIINAYSLLIQFFNKDYVYRIGGDEFLVFVSNTNEKNFKLQLKKLQEAMSQKTVCLAIGSIWKNKNNKEDINTLIAKADKLMYNQKKELYKTIEFDRRKNRN